MTSTREVDTESSLHSPERRSIWVVVAAGVPAVLYLVYILHYAVNVPYGDDWGIIPIVDAGAHGHLTLALLWAQTGDTRMFLTRLFFVAFGDVDHLNEKSIMLFSAALFIASFIVLLLLIRSYTGRRLTALPVLVVAVIWFSLVDIQNSLWGFQLAWYLVLFFFIAMIYLLLAQTRHGVLLFALGIVAAIAASLSVIQGFLLWPLGLICILWKRPWVRGTYWTSSIWLSSALLTALIYARGFSSVLSQRACGLQVATRCSVLYGLRHPVQATSFVLALIGNVVPTSVGNVIPFDFVEPHPSHLGAHELLGGALVLVAAVVVAQTLREPRRNPLPLLLIGFALLSDVVIALGRSGEGLAGAVNNNRFTMPNIVLLVGMAVFVLGHLPERATRPTGTRGRLSLIGLIGLAAIAAIYGLNSTRFGIVNGRVREQIEVTDARVLVNLGDIPTYRQDCYVDFGVFQGIFAKNYGISLYLLEPILAEAERDRLSVFQPSGERLYRLEGPPKIPQCE